MNQSTKTHSRMNCSNRRSFIPIAALCLALVASGSVFERSDITPKVEAANLVIVVPNALTSSEGNINNGFPFNLSPGTSIRYQQVYAASDFSGLQEPMLIKEIRFRPDAITGGPFNVTLHDIQINLSTTHRTPSSLSTVFADNVGPDDTVVVPRGPLTLSSLFTGPSGGPKAFDVVVTLTTPFLYDPSQGNLLLEVRNFVGGITRQFDAHFTSADSVARMWIFNSLGSPTGFTDSVGLVTAFEFEPANHQPSAFCRDITIPAGDECQATISPADVDAGSTDADPVDTLDLTLDSAGPLGLGDNLVTLTATDSHGASSSCQATVRVVDGTSPTISCPANVLVNLSPNNSSNSMAINYPDPTANDNCSIPSITTSPASGEIFPLGVTMVNATATDSAGLESSCSFTVTLLYNFNGFFQPVDNPPVVNTATAGSAIPVKFSLSGNKGLNILASGYPVSQQIACDSGAPLDEIEQTVTAGGSSLSYDASLDQYSYVWKTEKTWRGTCRQLIVRLNDTSTRIVNFRFR